MLTPLNDQIIVKRDEPKDISDGGIIMTAKQMSRWATVMAIGPGKRLKNGKRAPVDVEVGDRVMLAPLGAEIHYNDENYVIVRDKDITVKEF